MGTVYSVQYDLDFGHGGDSFWSLFESLTKAQQGIDTILWASQAFDRKYTRIKFALDFFEESRHVATVDLTAFIVRARKGVPATPPITGRWINWSKVRFAPPAGPWREDDVWNLPFGLNERLVNQDRYRQVLRCEPAWLATDDRRVVRIAEHIRATGDPLGLGVLADALDEAGCDNPWLSWHLRLPPAAHACGTWVVGYLLEQTGASA